MQGEPVPSTEKLMATGGTEEKAIAYRWSAPRSRKGEFSPFLVPPNEYVSPCR
jgi:hypothetical protein